MLRVVSYEKENFNSQPHKEADPSLPQKIYPVNISTHSLTRRLTSEWKVGTKVKLFQLTASQGG